MPELKRLLFPAGTAADLRAAHLERADPGLDAALGPVTVPNHPLAAVWQALLSILRDEAVGLARSAAASMRHEPHRA